MENIFENAYFGKAYKARDGRKAVYLKKGKSGKHAIIFENGTTYYVNPDGCYYNLEYFINPQDYITPGDIVSEWHEEINEEELDKLANEDAEKAYILKDSNYNLWYLVTETFKRGYRKAFESLTNKK